MDKDYQASYTIFPQDLQFKVLFLHARVSHFFFSRHLCLHSQLSWQHLLKICSLWSGKNTRLGVLIKHDHITIITTDCIQCFTTKKVHVSEGCHVHIGCLVTDTTTPCFCLVLLDTCQTACLDQATRTLVFGDTFPTYCTPENKSIHCLLNAWKKKVNSPQPRL